MSDLGPVKIHAWQCNPDDEEPEDPVPWLRPRYQFTDIAIL